MTTVINTPPTSVDTSNSGLAVIVGILVAVIAIIILFLVYGLPAIQANQAPQNGSVNVNLQLPTNGATPPAGNTPAAAPGTSGY